MGEKIRKYKNSVERFLSGDKGQRFFNFAYSIGAAIVIWGALFKILHLPGGNMLLSIGMGTEVLMFILTAFDRPPREYNWEEVFPVLDTKNPEDRPDFTEGQGAVVVSAPQSGVASVQPASKQGGYVAGVGAVETEQNYLTEMNGIAEQMNRLRTTTEALNQVSETLLASYRAITENSATITQSSVGYVEQMQALNRNISGLNTIYEIQLKSVSSQLDSIERVNQGIKDICGMYEATAAASNRYTEESQRMARYMSQLNEVYANMLKAMTVNMYGGAIPQPPTVPGQQANV